MAKVQTIAVQTDLNRAAAQFRYATRLLIIQKMFLSFWFTLVFLSTLCHHFDRYKRAPDLTGLQLDLLVENVVINGPEDVDSKNNQSNLVSYSNPSSTLRQWQQVAWIVLIFLQCLELIVILIESRFLIHLVVLVEFIQMYRRVEASQLTLDIILTTVWFLVLVLVVYYSTTLRRLYRHARLDPFAYRIPTPEISTYTVCGQQKIGVFVKSY